MIDTHVHLDADVFDADRGALWAAAQKAGVQQALSVGVSPASWNETVVVASTLPGVRCALGIHPQVVPTLDDAAIRTAMAALPKFLADSRAAAIGECGLDGPAGDLDRQKHCLLMHLDLARQLKLPVSLHVLKVHGAALTLLRAFGPLPAGGVVHSYSGSTELVREYLRLGFSISFAGAVTRSNAKRPISAAQAVPREHLLMETDAPYQPSGADARDRNRGEPADLAAVRDALAMARGQDATDIDELTSENARRIFAL